MTRPRKFTHVKALEAAGLIDKIAERRVRGAVEGIYQARARSYWLAPSLVGQIGSPSQARDQASLRVLLAPAEDVIEDAGRLGEQSGVRGVTITFHVSANSPAGWQAPRRVYVRASIHIPGHCLEIQY